MTDAVGLVEQVCLKCGGRIPENLLECPSEGCDYVRIFDQEQYDFLVACAYEPDEVTEEFVQQRDLPPIVLQEMSIEDWNRWRSVSDDIEIRLEGAQLKEANLSRAELNHAALRGANLNEVNLQNACLSRAHLDFAELNGAELYYADLNDACLIDAELNGADLFGAELEDARLKNADLNGAGLIGAKLNKANLGHSSLNRASLLQTDLNRANLRSADLKGANLASTKLRNTTVRQAEVNGATHIQDKENVGNLLINTRTDFRGVALEAATVQPNVLGQLQYCCRRLEWEDWYRDHWWLKWPVAAFWDFSDYGRSTLRILLYFLAFSLFFAAVYFGWGVLADGAPVQGLFIARDVQGGALAEAPLYKEVPTLIRPLRAVYFSVVTMTTLGFGDLTAQPSSFWGHVLLMVQVFLGYILLGALITRFAIMFEGGVGPVPKVEKAEGPIRQDSPWWVDAYRVQRFRARLMRFARPILLRFVYGRNWKRDM